MFAVKLIDGAGLDVIDGQININYGHFIGWARHDDCPVRRLFASYADAVNWADPFAREHDLCYEAVAVVDHVDVYAGYELDDESPIAHPSDCACNSCNIHRQSLREMGFYPIEIHVNTHADDCACDSCDIPF